MRSSLLLSLACTVALCAACDDEEGGSSETPIVLGAIFHDDVSPAAASRLRAIELAVDHVNEAGVFNRPLVVRNLSPALGDGVDAMRAADNARQLHDEHAAVGVVTLFSSIGAAVIEVTNSAGYESFVQCSCSATNVDLNNPEKSSGDQNDTFYRTVVSDAFQGGLQLALIAENGWTKVGVFYVDDPFGAGLASLLRDGLGGDLAFDASFPPGEFNTVASAGDLDAIVAASQAGELDVLVLPVLKAHSPPIIKHLTDAGYEGALLLSDGARADDVFLVANGLGAWLGAGHVMLGTEADTLGGASSSAFEAAFLDAAGEAPDTFSSTAYDCAFAFALALLSAGDEAEFVPAEVKAGIAQFKQDRPADAVEVGIGAAGVRAAADAIAAGKMVDYQGASGRLVFDELGDRPEQGMRTFGPNADATGWEVKARYDSDLMPTGAAN